MYNDKIYSQIFFPGFLFFWKRSIEMNGIHDLKIVQINSIIEALNTHSELREYTKNINLAAKSLVDSISLELCALFIILTHYGTQIGRYSFIHNAKVDNYVKNGNYANLIDDARSGHQSMIELIDNPYLLENDRIELYTILEREYNDMRSALFSGKEYDRITPYHNHKISSYPGQSLYEKCQMLNASLNESYPINTDPSRRVFIMDKEPDYLTPKICCFDSVELVKYLVKDFNPYTNTNFHPRLVQRLHQQYAKYIALYKRYQDWIKEQIDNNM